MISGRSVGVVIFLLIPAPVQGAGEESIQTGSFFRIICHFENNIIASEASKTAEMVWPLATQLLSVSGAAPREPAGAGDRR